MEDSPQIGFKINGGGCNSGEAGVCDACHDPCIFIRQTSNRRVQAF